VHYYSDDVLGSDIYTYGYHSFAKVLEKGTDMLAEVSSYYFDDLVLVVVFIMIPYVIWVKGRLTSLVENGQADRIPGGLQWIPWTNREYLEQVQRDKRPRDTKRWIIFLLTAGLILPSLYLFRYRLDPLEHRLVVILVSTILFFLLVALLEWEVRPR